MAEDGTNCDGSVDSVRYSWTASGYMGRESHPARSAKKRSLAVSFLPKRLTFITELAAFRRNGSLFEIVCGPVGTIGAQMPRLTSGSFAVEADEVEIQGHIQIANLHGEQTATPLQEMVQLRARDIVIKQEGTRISCAPVIHCHKQTPGPIRIRSHLLKAPNFAMRAPPLSCSYAHPDGWPHRGASV
jgi:hypothetical protein